MTAKENILFINFFGLSIRSADKIRFKINPFQENDYAHKKPAAKKTHPSPFSIIKKRFHALKKFPPDKNFPNDLFPDERDGTHKQKDHNHR